MLSLCRGFDLGRVPPRVSDRRPVRARYVQVQAGSWHGYWVSLPHRSADQISTCCMCRELKLWFQLHLSSNQTMNPLEKAFVHLRWIRKWFLAEQRLISSTLRWRLDCFRCAFFFFNFEDQTGSCPSASLFIKLRFLKVYLWRATTSVHVSLVRRSHRPLYRRTWLLWLVWSETKLTWTFTACPTEPDKHSGLGLWWTLLFRTVKHLINSTHLKLKPV